MEPATFSVLRSLKTESKPSRLDFAKWLFNTDNPLTGRVSANYIGKTYSAVRL